MTRRTGNDHRSACAAALADERGATMALVALSLVWMVGLASLVIDVGDGWSSRQNLVSATDAAALAGAQDLVDRPWDKAGACATASAFFAQNAPEATSSTCDAVSIGSEGGRLTFTASEDLEPTFAAVAPSNDSVGSVSSVVWGSPLTVSGLRPFAMCYDGSQVLRQLVDNPPSSPAWVRVDFTMDDPSECGGFAGNGNFATIDFDGGTSISEIRDWMATGYPGQLDPGPVTTIDCSGDAVCYERPYASNDIRYEIQDLRDSRQYATFPLYNYADGDQIHLVAAVRAKLWDYQLSGELDTWWVELYVEPGLIAGTCCGPPELDGGNKVIAICGIDPDSFAGCDPDGDS